MTVNNMASGAPCPSILNIYTTVYKENALRHIVKFGARVCEVGNFFRYLEPESAQ